ncbi:MAG TPA: tRNA (adenosine(37)-N6)-dimethylallyltransferase MiaA [Candidatus Paceibacterota bacterium]|nr:tRNA (adenosine(37)-N6)-dimethylallyltransferase MiaA [Candidatus Paceibacterota bacterium]
MKQKIIIVCGPTATGKSDYAVELAKKIDGEVISADSRQIYKGLDIGSGKITKKEMRGVPHHLLGVASPKRTFSVAQYKKLADKTIKDILSRGKTPILCGGTGFYIDAVIYDQSFPEVKADAKLRKLLSKLSLEELVKKLKNLDPKRLKTIDTKNKVRLIRAIEIASTLGFVPKKSKRKPLYSAQWIYLDFPDEVLKQRIHARLFARIRGITTEVTRLHKEGVSWKKLEALGLEYRYGALFLQKKLTKQEMLEGLEKAIWQYAKRQRTWFKKYAK